LEVKKAVTGFLQYKSAKGLAAVAVEGYRHDLKLWIKLFQQPILGAVLLNRLKLS